MDGQGRQELLQSQTSIKIIVPHVQEGARRQAVAKKTLIDRVGLYFINVGGLLVSQFF